MRIRVECRNISNKILPYNYQYGLASFLYNRIRVADKHLADKLHEKNSYKYYTFSWLSFNNVRRGKGLNFKHACFYVSSPDDHFITALAEGLLEQPDFHLYGLEMKIDSVEALPYMQFSNRATFQTLSPIYLKTLREVNGSLQTWDLYPDQPKWRRNLMKNLLARYQQYSHKSLANPSFTVTKVLNIERKRMNIADCYRRCAMVTFKAEGDPKLLEFGYSAGFGEKTAMGFGCVGVEPAC